MKRLALILLLGLYSIQAAAQLAVPNDAGLTYGHVHLNVSDIELHKRMWVEYFNGTVVERGPLTVIKLPNMMVALTAREPAGGSEGTVMDHFGFKVRNMQKFLDRWRAGGLGVDSEFTGAEGQPNAYVTMPDGVRVELQEDQSLPVEISGYHIHFFTPEYQALLQWYMDTFATEPRPRGRIAETTNVPGMNLSFATSDAPRLPTRGSAIDHIGFEVDNLQAFCQALEARGIVFDVAYREAASIGLKIAYLTDPSGVYIELTEGYDEY